MARLQRLDLAEGAVLSTETCVAHAALSLYEEGLVADIVEALRIRNLGEELVMRTEREMVAVNGQLKEFYDTDEGDN